jgi:3-phosphoglycerate kinase
MIYTLLKAKGISVGDSLVEDDKLDVAKEIINQY